MMKYLIYMDASGDVDNELVKSGKINFLPMKYMVNQDNYVNTGVNSKEELLFFYEELSCGKQATTTQINPYFYEEYFSKYLEDGYSILYLALSSGLSSTYNSAKLASENLNKKYNAKFIPIDSLNASVGMGLIAEKMVINYENGMDIYQNEQETIKFIKNIYLGAYVEDIMHLKRGGRISPTTAVFAQILNIKPLIVVTKEGKLENYGKKRGSKHAGMALVSKYEELGILDKETVVYIADCNNPQMIEYLTEKLKAINPKVIVKNSLVSPIIGAHLGPEAMVISFERK